MSQCCCFLTFFLIICNLNTIEKYNYIIEFSLFITLKLLFYRYTISLYLKYDHCFRLKEMKISLDPCILQIFRLHMRGIKDYISNVPIFKYLGIIPCNYSQLHSWLYVLKINWLTFIIIVNLYNIHTISYVYVSPKLPYHTGARHFSNELKYIDYFNGFDH